MRAPLVDAEQDGSIRITDLTKIVMARGRLWLAEERLVPFEATGNIAYTDDRPRAFHRISAVGLAPRISSYCEFLKGKRAWTLRLLPRRVRPGTCRGIAGT